MQLKEGISDARKFLKPDVLNSGRLSYVGNINERLLAAAAPNLTQSQQNYARKIADVTTSRSNNLSSTLRDLVNLEAEIRLMMPKGEIPVLLAAISVAKHSRQYWNDNSQKWENEFGSPETGSIANSNITWGDVGWMDAGSALVYGGGTAWLGFIPVLGWATWGIYTVGVSAACSGALAIGKIISDQYVRPSSSEWDLGRYQ